METVDLNQVLVNRGFNIVDVFHMDDTQYKNIMEWLDNERKFTVSEMTANEDLDMWRMAYLPTLTSFTKAQLQLQKIIDSPLIEITANGWQLTTFRACQVWDKEVVVQKAPTEEFVEFMREHIAMNLDMFQEHFAEPLTQVEWTIVGSPVGTIVKITPGQPVTGPIAEAAKEYLLDYGLWVGNCITSASKMLTVEMLTPRTYVEEAIEASDMREAEVYAFLKEFYGEEDASRMVHELFVSDEM